MKIDRIIQITIFRPASVASIIRYIYVGYELDYP